jgi:hypothetical protein
MKTICSILLAGTLGLLGGESPSAGEPVKALVPTTVEVPLSKSRYSEWTRPHAFRSELRNEPGLEQISRDYVYAY